MHSGKSKRNFKKLRIPLTRSDHTNQFRDHGFVVDYDPSGKKNSQFSAICFRLSQTEIFRATETLGRDVVSYLRDTEIMNGVPIELLAGVPMEQYLYEMYLETIYGDEITHRAIENIFRVEVNIILILGEHGRVNILP